MDGQHQEQFRVNIFDMDFCCYSACAATLTVTFLGCLGLGLAGGEASSSTVIRTSWLISAPVALVSPGSWKIPVESVRKVHFQMGAEQEQQSLITHMHTHTLITLRALRLWYGLKCCSERGNRWYRFGFGSRQGWSWCVFEKLQVVDNVVSNQRAATKGPPIDHSDTERRVQEFIVW